MSIEELREKNEAYITAAEAAKALGISKKTFYKNVRKFPFQILQFGRTYWIPKNPFIEFLQKGCVDMQNKNDA